MINTRIIMIRQTSQSLPPSKRTMSVYVLLLTDLHRNTRQLEVARVHTADLARDLARGLAQRCPTDILALPASEVEVALIAGALAAWGADL